MYIRARREAIKIAEKAVPGVIIWFRPPPTNRRESGDIRPPAPFRRSRSRSRRQPVRRDCRIGDAVGTRWFGQASRDRTATFALASAMKKAAGSISSGPTGLKIDWEKIHSAPVFSGYPSYRRFGVQKTVPPRGTGNLLRRRHRIYRPARKGGGDLRWTFVTPRGAAASLRRPDISGESGGKSG